MSGYLLYSSRERSKIISVPGVSNLTILGENWKKLSDDEKDEYNQESKELARIYFENKEKEKE